MVAKMMRWRPWPPLTSRKFRVRLVVRGVEGMGGEEAARDGHAKVVLEVRWKGPKATLSSLRRSLKRNRTREEQVGEGGDVEWNEEFETVCTLASYRENAFGPWEVTFSVISGLDQGSKNKETVVGMASINLAEFVSITEDEVEINLPLLVPDATSDSHPTLHLVLSSLEIRTSQESSDALQKAASPLLLASAGDPPAEKDELSAIKAGLRKVKILTDFVSTHKSKKSCHDGDRSDGKCSGGSDDAEYAYPFDTDSHDDDIIDRGKTEDSKEDNSVRKSFSYGILASAKLFGGSVYYDMKMDGEYEDCIYYSYRRSDVGCSHMEETSSTVVEESVSRASKRSILPWKKRKLSFRSPKAKGEPLLKKAYGEEGGDDIDYDRRLLSSSDESLTTGRSKGDDDSVGSSLSVSEFGDDNFVIGSWESRELVNRDRQLKLLTQVFFASIDQRSERASGESACTALVAVIADWFQKNQNMMPIKSQFDDLIREGSYEWRSLCENQTCRELFPDKHFDLDTVLQAKIRRLSVVPSKSFIGFFHPEHSDNGKGFDLLHGAMSFDGIWDEISRAREECTSDGNPHIYIVSWNDHFFILKVERDAYYIIDTLGERLYEGCNQAYILKFDESTAIYKHTNEGKSANSETSSPGHAVRYGSTKGPDKGNCTAEDVVCRGKESCREYIKNFLAAIPIRQLQEDIKKGRMSSAPLHRRLQIEFHYTDSSEVGENLVATAQVADPTPEASCSVEQAMTIHPSPAIAVG